MSQGSIHAVASALADYFKAIPKTAIAFSGGVDSSYLLYAAKACGVDVHAYYVSSQFQPSFELEDAVRLADGLEIPMTIIKVDALSSDVVKSNPSDRCYYCKQVVFGNILERAAADGYTVLMDGTNASDDSSDRPGMKALAELKVLSPLREVGLTKSQVRAHSKEAGLFTWDKPAYACLATRIPTGTALDNETLQRVEQAEGKLSELGFRNYRARVLSSRVTKLQLPADQLPVAVQRHEELVAALSPWFDDVLLDLKPR